MKRDTFTDSEEEPEKCQIVQSVGSRNLKKLKASATLTRYKYIVNKNSITDVRVYTHF